MKADRMEEVFSQYIDPSGYKKIPPEEIVFYSELRDLCAMNRCGCYGKTWASPPATGTFEECRERCLPFSDAVLFCASYTLEDDFDYDGMMAGHRRFKQLCDDLWKDTCKENLPMLLLSNEGCIRCEKCTYPDFPCRYPAALFPSIEGYGIHVAETAGKVGLCYSGGKNSVTYFGMLLYTL